MILLSFLCTNLAFADEKCTPKELEALKTLQSQLVLVCDAVDFDKLPEELKKQGIQEQCKTLTQREITQESCVLLKAEIEKSGAVLPNLAIPQLPQSSPAQKPAQ